MNLPVWLRLGDSGGSCWRFDCIISATAARVLGLAAKPDTIASTSSDLRVTVVTEVVVGVGVDDISTWDRLLPLEVGTSSAIIRVDTIVHTPELAPFLSRDYCLNSGLGVFIPHDYQLIAGVCVILLVLTTVKLLTSITETRVVAYTCRYSSGPCYSLKYRDLLPTGISAGVGYHPCFFTCYLYDPYWL